jgi:ABC transport system ATP-binding/permease protein
VAGEPNLFVVAGGARFEFREPDAPVSVGSDETSAIRVEHPLVSRRHGRFEVDGGRWVFRDVGSTNGSFIEGRRIEVVAVQTGTVISLAAPDGPSLACTVDGAAAPTRVDLEVRVGTTAHHVSTPGPAVVGRDPHADIVVDDPRVSRRHVELRLDGDVWVAVDTSSNGTFVDGERRDRVPIEGPLRLRLGAADGPAVDVAPPGQVPRPARPGGAITGAMPMRSSLLVGDLRSISKVHQPRAAVVRMGRAPDNDIVVDDVIVSRYHAELHADAAGGFELVDLGSFNGTFLNGRRVERARMLEGDIASVGRSKFLMRAGALEEYEDTGDIAFEAKGLVVRIPGGKVILDEVSFSLPERSLMGVIGPSGAGKSTLVNALTGFRPAQEGTVLYDGRDLYASYDDLRQRIGYVPQDDILHTQLTVRRALDYAAKLRFPPDVDADLRRARVEEVMDQLGILERADVRIRSLSGGQRKRASVAIELLTRPSLLFLDEPTSGLDPGYERTLTELLRDLADDGRTVVVVTHSVQSLDLCDRMLVLAPGGSVAFYGPPEDVPGYFGDGNYAEVFRALESEDGATWKRRYMSHPAHQQYVATPLAARQWDVLEHAEEVTPPRRQGWFRQFSTLVRRNLAVMLSDRRLLLTMLLQAPLLGYVMLFTLSRRELMPHTDMELMRFSTAAIVLAVLVVGVTALGLSNSIREIVKELPVYGRERAVGLSPSAYVASKALVLGVLTAVQSAILVYIAVRRQGPGWGAAFFEEGVGPFTAGETELMIGMMLGGVAAMALGLLVSAGAKTVDQAATLIPILLVVQLLFSGAFRDVVDNPGGRQISWFTAGHWSYSAGASTVDLNTLQNFNDCLLQKTKVNRSEDVIFLADCVITPRSIGPLEVMLRDMDIDPFLAELMILELRATDLAQRAPEIPEPSFRFWDQTRDDWLAATGLITLHVGVALVGAWLLLRLRDRRLMDAR